MGNKKVLATQPWDPAHINSGVFNGFPNKTFSPSFLNFIVSRHILKPVCLYIERLLGGTFPYFSGEMRNAGIIMHMKITRRICLGSLNYTMLHFIDPVVPAIQIIKKNLMILMIHFFQKLKVETLCECSQRLAVSAGWLTVHQNRK